MFSLAGSSAAAAALEISDEEFASLAGIVHRETGIHLTDSKRSLLAARLSKRIRAKGMKSFNEYYQFLNGLPAHDPERQEFINAVTTNLTQFFREPHHFDFLRTRVFREIEAAARRGQPRRVRIWCAASSTGQEPYTLAMTLLEHFPNPLGWDFRILASDIDTRVLETAQRGQYGEEQLRGLSEERRRRFFRRTASGWHVSSELRRLISFRQINLMAPEWPIRTKFDAIFVRNVLIYFDAQTQVKLIGRFEQYLANGSYLFVGHSENLAWRTSRFKGVGPTVYQLRGAATVEASEAGTAAIQAEFEPARRTIVTIIPSAQIAPKSPSKPVDRHEGAFKASEQKCPPSKRKTIVAGEYFASSNDVEVSTTLGSCIAACLYDPVAKVGGMNHFMLPDCPADAAASARYGIHAMELLINEILQRGGNRDRLVAKIFGGGSVLPGLTRNNDVGRRNHAFAEEYLRTEGITIVAQKVCGERALAVRMWTQSGRVFAREVGANLPNSAADSVAKYAESLKRRVVEAPVCDITLF